MRRHATLASIVLLSIGVHGCARGPAIERETLKALLDIEMIRSAEVLFDASYDPANGRLMSHAEILSYLKDQEIAAEDLPADLSAALEAREVVGVLVSHLDPLPARRMSPRPAKLDDRRRVMLLWEMHTNRAFTALWLGANGGNGGEGGACPGGAPKCADYPNCGSDAGKFVFCIGVYRCPPCTKKCKPCSSPDPPIAG